ncbi:hypothetical protein HYALB_00009180 [Hymenoscyphus albidus]|uniref:Uncharacterized protein n=1 Tax=Hymenoscyphus albidus TaxID=595503 RepID=A0A9N9M0M4_9HELO|nr:hypothetical protein HYALB_00009180 [Hymenoscyphus albidus]
MKNRLTDGHQRAELRKHFRVLIKISTQNAIVINAHQTSLTTILTPVVLVLPHSRTGCAERYTFPPQEKLVQNIPHGKKHPCGNKIREKEFGGKGGFLPPSLAFRTSKERSRRVEPRTLTLALPMFGVQVELIQHGLAISLPRAFDAAGLDSGPHPYKRSSGKNPPGYPKGPFPRADSTEQLYFSTSSTRGGLETLDMWGKNICAS